MVKVDFAKVKGLENDMFKKWTLEAYNRRIDFNAAITQPESPAGARRRERCHLKAKVVQSMQSCYVPGTVDTSAH